MDNPKSKQPSTSSTIPSIPWYLLFLSATLMGTAVHGEGPKGAKDFQRDIRPILAEHCIGCHGRSEPRSNLRLTSRQDLLVPAESGTVAVIPGKPDQSELLRRITSDDPHTRMPPDDKQPLSQREIDSLRQWIEEGANWSQHWAFLPLTDASPPDAITEEHHPIDRFVTKGLHELGTNLSPEADRITLCKRLSYDLLGLPPDPDKVKSFVKDERPDAFQRLVDGLLESPHFGERWGRHWLDLAHYADSDGYEKDRARPDAYLYRDWVTKAFNEDMPFDRFTIAQIAGDLLSDATSQDRLATAFFRQTLTNEEGGVDQEEYRIAACFDRTETLGTVWFGLTIGCARCHSHKYDSLPHRDYFRLFAYFNNADETQDNVVLAAEDREIYEARSRELLGQLRDRYRALAPASLAWETEMRAQLLAVPDAKGREEILQNNQIVKLLEMYPEKRVADTRKQLFEYFVTKVAEDADVKTLQQQLKDLEKDHHAEWANARTIGSPLRDRETHVFDRGEYLSPTEKVTPGVPGALLANKTAPSLHSRLDLARWLVSEENPLTARVAVNQIWSHLFGKGLVRTGDDFGVRGQPPTHPELLDHLATKFRRDFGWQRKELIRYILASATYRQQSHHRPEWEGLDPDNRLLFRQNRFRVEAEIVRDLCLAVGGLLSYKVGGPSVFPAMPDELAKLSYANNFTWKTSEGEDRYRRGMYTFFKRTIPHPGLTTFDAPDANVPCVARTISNTPLQSLTLFNNQTYFEAAKGLAQQASGTDRERMVMMFRRCLARDPREHELSVLQQLLNASVASTSLEEREANDTTSAWNLVARVLLNLDEFLTRE
jgi:hypothetical protein